MRKVKSVSRWVLSLLMISVGVTHFVNSGFFVAIVPAFLPFPLALVYISGFFEIMGGAGLCLPRFRKAAAWGLVLLYLAVFPANINMALNNISPPGGDPLAPWMLWARLPFQAVFIAWAYWQTRDDPARVPASGSAASSTVTP